MQTSSTGLMGLSEGEAEQKHAAGEGNVAPPLASRTYPQIVVENVFTFVNSCLFALGLALLLLHRPMDALISTGVILLNVLVSVVQEIRAKRILDRIALLTRPTATVVRSGRAREVPPEELVAGDLVKLEPGDQVTADGRVIAGSASLDESLLTGESDLIEKREGDPLYSGTFCARGQVYFRAESVGAKSLSYQLTAGARAFRRVLTPLQGEINRVIRIALLLVLFCEFLLVLRSLLQGIDLVTSVQNSTLVASLVPNGLFLSISVAYALAAVRIVRFGALIQQANAVESLSHVDTICLDKTGTLTANRLVLSAITPISTSESELRRLLGAFVASGSGGTKSTEAIAAACPEPAQGVSAEVLFSSERKWSALAFEATNEESRGALHGFYVLGAPEMIMPAPGNPDVTTNSADWHEVARCAEGAAAKGLRVLLFAHADETTPIKMIDGQPQLPYGLRPLGLVMLSDVLRPEAGATLAAFVQAGVKPKIISGDHPETVATLARSAGLDSATEATVSGLDLDQMDDQRFRETANTATIFGRVTPQQKERLVRAMRQDGRYVAMIGDGVNDVLSLKQADVAIAMRSSSQATRGVADIILMEDSFAPLVPSVLEGQRILNGMRTILQLFLVRIGTVGTIVFSSLVIGEFPLALRHGSLVTLFSVGLPTVLLAVWARPGVSPKGSFASRLLHFVVTPVVVTTVLALLLLYGSLFLDLLRMGALAPGATPLATLAANDAARAAAQSTLAVFLVFAGLFLVIFAEPPTLWWAGGNPLSGDRRPTYLALALMTIFLVLLAVPPLRGLFALTSLDLLHIGLIAVALLAWLFTVRALWRARFFARVLGGPSRWTSAS